MEMTENEIRRRYKDSESKQKAIKILAELNNVGTDVIRAIIRDKGEIAEKMSKKGKKAQEAYKKAVGSGSKLMITEPKDKIPQIPQSVIACIRRRVVELVKLYDHCDQERDAALREYGELKEWAVSMGINI